MLKVSGIYKIQSQIKPHRIYIGSAKDVFSRWGRHLRKLRKGSHHSIKLQRHYNKYGEADLSFTVLSGWDINNMLDVEQFYIDAYNPYFNMAKIVRCPTLGCRWKLSEVSRKNMMNNGIETRFKKGSLPQNSKKVVNKITGEVHNSIDAAAKSINMKPHTLEAQLSGINRNKTNFGYYGKSG